MKLTFFTAHDGLRIAIPVDKITGIIESGGDADWNTFIATGIEGVDGGENGWYVEEKYGEVVTILEACK